MPALPMPATMKQSRTPLMPVLAVLLGLGLFSIMDGVMKAASIMTGAYAAMFWRGLAGSVMMIWANSTGKTLVLSVFV